MTQNFNRNFVNPRIQPKIVVPFSPSVIAEITEHVSHIRGAFDWPGNASHDQGASQDKLFNRWFWHNLPLLKYYHHDPDFIKRVSDIVGIPLKPSYAFLSLYTRDGICPLHTDRPQCQYTVDLQLETDGTWPIYVDDRPYVLESGQALAYSGTGQPHYRKSMKEDGKNCTYMNLAFFHFVPTWWMGSLE